MAARDSLINNLSFDLKEKSNLVIEKIPSPGRALILAEFVKQQKRPLLLVMSEEAGNLSQEISFFFNGPLITFPSIEGDKTPDFIGARLDALQALHETSEPFIALVPLPTLFHKTPAPGSLKKSIITLKVGETIQLSDLKELLMAMGYEPTTAVADKAEFAARGGLIDCFPVNARAPLRIEFFGNEIDSLRSFDPTTQRSLERVKTIDIAPAKENDSASLLDHFSKDTIVAFDDLVSLEDLLVSLKATEAFSSLFKPSSQKLFFLKEHLEDLTEVGKKGGLIHFEWAKTDFQAERLFHPFSFLDELPGSTLIEALEEDTERACWFVCQSPSDEALVKNKIPESLKERSSFVQGHLSSGLLAPTLILVPSHLLTERRLLKRGSARAFAHTTSADILHLEPGDLVVHFHHGIGQYRGVERKPNHLGVENEFLVIQYAGGSTLFLPLDKAFLLTKYVGSDEESVSLHELGSTKWQKQRAKSEASINAYAKDLVSLYAIRKMPRSNPCSSDGEFFKRFEEEFPYELTDDQRTAIASVKTDLQNETCMDRLVCGDVGFGKTEVAMRAAFKTVVDGGKQVAVLAPTTILALQHFETFSHRMAGFPVRIGHLSRFVHPKEQKKTVQAIADGSVDIVIATHRLLSHDIAFQNLGLLIIDEEQRFGVKAKEHLKSWKKDVDSLAMSATPIPRTLYLSLSGARDLSVINTPPYDRLPVKTIITEKTDETIKTALLRELARGGQAFFIHNRVETIGEAAKRLQTLLPAVKIGIAHGQMDSDEIDSIFHSFKKGDIQILVATTIVENGIDIPNANTILIDRSDHFGLSELHQLRGRVGRWNKRAYCYFLLPAQKALSQIAYKRLEALATSSGFGAGMKVALRDLEIRGAGNILGTEQSGQVETIGFHLYCKLLKRQVDNLQGKDSLDPLSETKLELSIDARLPEDYVNAIELRMEFYQRAGEASSLQEVDLLFDELIDRFGPLPEPARFLKTLSHLRVVAREKGLTLVRQQKSSLYLEGKTGKKSVLCSFPKDPEAFEKAVFNVITS